MLDTSLAVELEALDRRWLPADSVVSTLTVAELVSGPRTASTPGERRRRSENLRLVESSLNSLPFDSACAHAFGVVYLEVMRTGRKPRGRRVVDLMIASTALAHSLPIYTLNAADLRGLEGVVQIVDLG